MITKLAARIAGRTKSLSLGRYRHVALVLLLGVVLTVVFVIIVQDHHTADARAEFERQAKTYVAALRKGIERNLEVIESIGGLFAATAVVDRQDFQAFVKGPLSRHQEIQALSWNQRVKDSNRASYEAAIQNDGFPSFQITERKAQGQMERAERRAEYISVTYIEPLKGNEAALGFDVASDPTRVKALERSRETGEMVATARITLVQETEEQIGILILKPVYKSGAPHETVQQRSQNLTGFAVGVFRISDMVEAALDGLGEGIVNIQLVDRASPTDEGLLYLGQASDSDNPADEEQLKARGELYLREPLEIPGRQWSLLITPASELLGGPAAWEVWGVLAGGLLITALAVAYLITVINHSAKTQRRQQELQKLSRRLVETQEAERRHVARELHDEIGQALTGLKFSLEMVPRLPPQAAAVSLGNAQAMVNELMGQVRDLSLDLRPPMLDDLGLLPALLWYLERYTSQTGVEVSFEHMELENRLDVQVETAAYRIVQEGLTNVARHATVTEVSVMVWAGEDMLHVRIHDNGVGFSTGNGLQSEVTSGLSGIRERAQLLGGHLVVESAPGHGTTLTAELPRQ